MNPIHFVKQMELAFPRGYKAIKAMYLDKGKGRIDWPDWCFVPVHTIVNDDAFLYDAELKSQGDLTSLLEMLVLLDAAATWRMTKGIYRFDADVYKELVEQDFQGDLPTEHLMRLPEWCVYIETPGMDESDGFMALLSYNQMTEQPELVMVVFAGECASSYSIPVGNFGIEKALRTVIERNMEGLERIRAGAPVEFETAAEFRAALENDLEDHLAVFARRLNLLLYLCSDNADLPDIHSYRRGRKSERLMAADAPSVWDVGIRVGAAIRKYCDKEEAESVPGTDRQHGSPRPHIRRAHWHSFWAGKKAVSDERKLVLHWLPPVPVNVDENELPAVIRPVKK